MPRGCCGWRQLPPPHRSKDCLPWPMISKKNVASVISTGGHKFSCRFSCFLVFYPFLLSRKNKHVDRFVVLRVLLFHFSISWFPVPTCSSMPTTISCVSWPRICNSIWTPLWQISPSPGQLTQSHPPPHFFERLTCGVGWSTWLRLSRAIRQLCRRIGKTPHWLLPAQMQLSLDLGMSGIPRC